MNLCLLGSPVASSASPAMQNAALRALGLGGSYVAHDVDVAGVESTIARLRAGEIDGANITAPYKRLAFELADAASPLAADLEAANTWTRLDDGTVAAENTDVIGLRASLAVFAPRARNHALLLGAGGAARAAALVLSHAFERVTVLARDPAAARAMAVDVVGSDRSGDAVFAPARWPRSAYTRRRLLDAVSDAELVVNAANLDVSGVLDALRWMPWRAIPASCVFLDLGYSRTSTPFATVASAHGRAVNDGAVMLLHQGAASFARWTKQVPPLEIMRDALAVELSREPAAIPTVPSLIARDVQALGRRAGS